MKLEEKIKLAKAIYTRELRKQKRPHDYFIPQNHPQLNQLAFIQSTKRNIAALGGNRVGKTLLGAISVIGDCIKAVKEHKPYEAWCGTWADMSIPVQQKEVYKWLPKDGSVKYAKFSEQRGFSNRIVMFNDKVIIRFKTYDQGRESFQGTAKDKIWLDEEPPAEIVSECKARLIDRNGVLIRTMTPLNGITYTYDEFITNENNDPEIEYFFFDSRFNKYIDQDAQKRIINNYAEKEAEVRQTGHFLNLTSGAVYYPFSNQNIIGEPECLIKSFEPLEYRPIEVSCDFNIDLMCWHIGQEINGMDYTFDYVELEGQANTELLCNMLKDKIVKFNAGLIFYGDISGSQRRPEASRTNWAIIKDMFPHAKIYYEDIRNIKDRVDATNARLKNNAGHIQYYITSNCKRLIKDYRQVTWEMLLNKNKAGKLTHASDGETYRFNWKYSLKGRPQISKGEFY